MSIANAASSQAPSISSLWKSFPPYTHFFYKKVFYKKPRLKVVQKYDKDKKMAHADF